MDLTKVLAIGQPQDIRLGFLQVLVGGRDPEVGDRAGLCTRHEAVGTRLFHENILHGDYCVREDMQISMTFFEESLTPKRAFPQSAQVRSCHACTSSHRRNTPPLRRLQCSHTSTGHGSLTSRNASSPSSRPSVHRPIRSASCWPWAISQRPNG